MKLKINFSQNNVVYILTIIFIASFTIMSEISYGRYVMLAAAVLVFCNTNSVKKGKLFLGLDLFQWYIILLAIFCMLSSLWATYSKQNALSKGATLVAILIAFYPFYVFYKKKDDVNMILKPLMWAGLLIAAYTFAYYGINTVISIISVGSRIPNDFANSNTIGMSVSMSVIIAFYYFLDEGVKLSTIMAIPSVLIVAVSGSRKAFVMLVLGVVLLYIIHSLEEQNIKLVVRIIAGLVGFFVLIVVLKDSAIFSGVLERMEGLIAAITGVGSVDNSTQVRNQYIKLGIELFTKNPFVGIGIDNAKFYTIDKAYLHNNYIELLADGGIIGVGLFYSIYGIILFNLWKCRRKENKLQKLIFTMVILDLIMQYGYVSYYDKLSYFYIMVYCLFIKNARKSNI